MWFLWKNRITMLITNPQTRTGSGIQQPTPSISCGHVVSLPKQVYRSAGGMFQNVTCQMSRNERTMPLKRTWRTLTGGSMADLPEFYSVQETPIVQTI
jgi:hypothetical protein